MPTIKPYTNSLSATNQVRHVRVTLKKVRMAMPSLVSGLPWLISGVCAAMVAIVVAYVGAIDAPYWDHWRFVDPSQYLAAIIEPHNEHPIVFGRILFAIDYYLFGAAGISLQIILFLFLFIQVLAFGAIAWIASLRRAGLIATLGFAAAFSFNPQAWENLIWPFQAPFVAAGALTVAATAALIYAAVRPADTRAVWAAWLGGAVAPFALSNGLLTPFLLSFAAIRLRLRRRVWIVLLAIGVAAIAVLASAPPGVKQSRPMVFSDVPVILDYIFAFAGAPLTLVLDHVFSGGGVVTPRFETAFIAGGLLVLLSGQLAARSIFAQNPDPVKLGLSLLIVFLGASMAATAVGRIGFGAYQALSPRYTYFGGILWVSTFLLLALELRSAMERLHPWGRQVVSHSVLVLTAAASLSIAWSGFHLVPTLTAQQRDRLAGQTALVVGVRDYDSISKISFDIGLAETGAQFLRENGKGFFIDPWSRRVGERIDLGGAVSNCPGAVEMAHTGAATDGYVRLRGWVDRRAARSGKTILIVSDGGRIDGYARVSRRPSDFVDLPGPRNNQLDWIGHARVSDLIPPFEVYLAGRSGIVCRLSASKSA